MTGSRVSKCLHCKAREPLDDDGFCLDYNACTERQPLAGSRRTRTTTVARLMEPGETVTTKTGKVLTHADFEALADEAERGYDVSRLKRPPDDIR